MKKPAYQVKLKNRRVVVSVCSDCGQVNMAFKMLTPDKQIKKTKLSLSEEAFNAVARCYGRCQDDIYLESLKEETK